MAILTSQPHMRAGEREIAEVMVEGCVRPIGWVVAGSAVCAILTVVFIIRLVAGITVHGRAFVLIVHMAGFTFHLRVFPLQFERRQVVIELCGSPAICCVALAAIQPEAALMRFIVVVTGMAILGGHREVIQAARVEVTLHASKIDMRPGQLEGN